MAVSGRSAKRFWQKRLAVCYRNAKRFWQKRVAVSGTNAKRFWRLYRFARIPFRPDRFATTVSPGYRLQTVRAKRSGRKGIRAKRYNLQKRLAFLVETGGRFWQKR